MADRSPTAFANEFCSRSVAALTQRENICAAQQQRVRAVLFALYLGTWRALYDARCLAGEPFLSAAEMRPRCDALLASGTAEWGLAEVLPKQCRREIEALFHDFADGKMLSLNVRIDAIRSGVLKRLQAEGIT